MEVGDLVRVKQRYAEWGYGVGILLERHTVCKCRVLFGDSVVIFYKHELEVINEK